MLYIHLPYSNLNNLHIIGIFVQYDLMAKQDNKRRRVTDLLYIKVSEMLCYTIFFHKQN